MEIAVKGIIEYGSKILIIRESQEYKEGTQAGRYDFPGGRIKHGENFLDGFKREVKEETGLDVIIEKIIFANQVNPTKNLHIVRLFYRCKTNAEQVKLSEDHDDYLWINASSYKEHNLISNLHPIMEEYLSLIK